MKTLLLAALLSVSLGFDASAREVTDMLGRKVDVPENPKKIYAPSPYGSYALYAMDPTLLTGWIFDIDEENLPYLHPSMKTLPTIG